MREQTIARNYAAALFELGQRHDEAQAYADALDVLDDVLADPTVQRFMDTPKVEMRAKEKALTTALEGKVPERFLHFLIVVVRKRRQGVLRAIRREYRTLLDAALGRVHADVTLAREADDEARDLIAERLSRLLGKDVIPNITVDPAILGGLVVRFGDRAMDGSLRRQLMSLKREMMSATLPELPDASYTE